MNLSILNTAVQIFIVKHLGADTIHMLFGKSPFSDVSTRELVEQIESKKRCEKKLPLWYATPGIYYPPKLAIEQASSQVTAQYKSQLVKGERILDITGGFGVDAYYFSLRVQQVVHCETNEALSIIAQHNAKVFQANNMFFHKGSGMEYLKNSDEQFDTIYLDPSRRIKTQKVFRLSDCEPDVFANRDILDQANARIIIKTSPLLDLKSGLADLKNVSEVHIVSVRNECKELLWVIDPDFQDGETIINCVSIDKNEHIEIFRFQLSEEKQCQDVPLSGPLTFIYEPDVALLKGGCFKLITKKFSLLKLHQHSHLYTSEILNTHFIGRKYRLEQSWSYKSFMKEKPIKQANIISRNFPLSADELKKKHLLKDGGNTYLLFTKEHQNQLIVLACTLI